MAQIFNVKEDGFDEVRRQLLVVLASISLIICVGVFSYFYLTGRIAHIATLVFAFVVFAVFLVFSFKRRMKKFKRNFESYRLIIDDIEITRERDDLSPVIIRFEDIKSISQARKGAVTIRGKGFLDFIVIPSQIERHNELIDRLNEIQPVKPAKGEKRNKILVFSAIPLTLIVGFLAFSHPRQVVAVSSALIFFLLMAAALILIQTSKEVDESQKRRSWIILIPILACLGNIYLRFFS